MAKKSTSKSSSARHQPNAPELQQILQQSSVQQPPLNPYYPDISSVTAHNQPPPPPYSSQSARAPVISSAATYHSVPMSHLNNDINYPSVGNHGHTPVIIQAQSVRYDHRADRYRRKVRTLTNQSMVLVILSVLMSLWAYQLYKDRHCFESFVVHKPDKEIEITIGMVRNMHLNLAYAGGLVFILCLLRSSFGFDGKSFGCYLFLLSMITFAITAYTAYMAWLSFYSPCPGTVENVVNNAVKWSVSKLTDNIPSPDKNFFGESNVLVMAKDDPKGLMIFILDVGSFIFYFSMWVSSITTC